MTHPYIAGGQKVSYSNSSLKLWIERKYAIKLILVKNYKRATVFASYSKVAGRYQKSFSKPSKKCFQNSHPI